MDRITGLDSIRPLINILYPAGYDIQPPTGYAYDRKSCKIEEVENFIVPDIQSTADGLDIRISGYLSIPSKIHF